MVRRLVSGRRHLLYAKPPKPPAMPCRWFLFVRPSAMLRWLAGAGSDWTADGLVATSPVNPFHRRRGAGDFALQDAFQAVFPSISRGRFATFSCRHRFVHLSFRNKSAFAETKLWASPAAFAFGGRTVEFALQTSGTACGSCLPGLRAPSRTRPGAGAVCMSDVWSP
jgi:hypothetical protein